MRDPAEDRIVDWVVEAPRLTRELALLIAGPAETVEISNAKLRAVLVMVREFAMEIGRYRTNLSISEGRILDTTPARDPAVPLKDHLLDILNTALSRTQPVVAMRSSTLAEIVEALR